MSDKLLDILPLIKTFPKNTKIGVGFLFISVGILFILYPLGFDPFPLGMVISFFAIVILTPPLLLPLCFLLLRRKWAWRTAIIWLGIVVFICAVICVLILFSQPLIEAALKMFIYTLVLWSSFLFFVLDKKNFDKIIIEEKEKITFIKKIVYMVLFSISLMFLTAVCLMVYTFIILLFLAERIEIYFK